MNALENAKELKRMMKTIIKEVVQEETKACLRVYKATVIAAPYTDPQRGSVCQIRLSGDSSVLTVPYSSKVQSMSVGDLVLVAPTFGSMRNAIVWEFQNFK